MLAVQLKSLERSFDELMSQNIAGGAQTSKSAAARGADDEFDNFLGDSAAGAPRSRLAAARNKNA